MRDYCDAKAMAQSLREALNTKQISVSHSESLELVSKTLGVSDWNTLSALLSDNSGRPRWELTAGPRPALPAFPIRDFVAFPAMQFPMVLGRRRTIEALTQAFACRGELVMVAQRQPSVDEPGPGDVHAVGVIGRVIDVGPVSLEKFTRRPELKGATQVLLQSERRVNVRSFSADGDWYQADVDDIDEGAIPSAPELIAKAASAFERYSAVRDDKGRDLVAAPMGPPLGQLHNPGRVADLIAVQLLAPVAEKQAILETLDPIKRLERVVTHLEA